MRYQIEDIPVVNLGLSEQHDNVKLRFLENTEDLKKEHVFIYTDGSKKHDGVHCPSLNYSFFSR